MPFSHPVDWIVGGLLILSSIGVTIATKPVHASLSFLLTLFVLAVLYLQLSAEFIAVMQLLVYAGAILVLFMFVIVLFQEAHQHISLYQEKSARLLVFGAASIFVATLVYLGFRLLELPSGQDDLPQDFGTVQSLGEILYRDFFFPFEAITLLFLIAIVGALHIGKRTA